MSRATKRKHVLREIWEDDFSHPKPNQQIVKIISCRGNNLHEVQTPEGESYLVSMPNKFRQTFWVRRGQYVIVDPIEEGHKVKGEIARIVTDKLIKSYHKDKVWPSAFEDATKNKNAYPAGYNKKREHKSDSDTCSDDELFRNPNVRRYAVMSSDSDTENSEEDETGSEDGNNYQEGHDNQSEHQSHH